MNGSITPEVSILIPNFRTPLLTKLCLRSLRKYTDRSRIRVLAVDNGSGEGEESLEYLRGLKWITLVENHPDPGLNPAEIHARSLDLLLERVDTEFVLSFHTDTIVHSSEWLDYLLAPMRESDKTAGVGSWKLETSSPLKRFGKSLEDLFRKHVLHPLTGRRLAIAGEGTSYKYLRSHCALFRTLPVREHTRGFFDGLSACKSMYKMLEDSGFRMVFLPEAELAERIAHFDHATMVLNPELGGRRTTRPKARRRLSSVMEDSRWLAVLDDESLDR